MCCSARVLRAGHFLLLAQKKVTKENGTLGSALALCASALRADGVLLTRHPASQRNARGPSRAPACAARGPDPSALRRVSEGPKSKSFCFCGRSRAFLLLFRV